MRDDTEMAAKRRLVKAGEDLYHRLSQGEDVTADLEAWLKRIEKNTTPASRVYAEISLAYVRMKAKFRAAITGMRHAGPD
jgi:hypothetical protein